MGPFPVMMNVAESGTRIAHAGDYVRFESGTPAIITTAKECGCEADSAAIRIFLRRIHDPVLDREIISVGPVRSLWVLQNRSDPSDHLFRGGSKVEVPLFGIVFNRQQMPVRRPSRR